MDETTILIIIVGLVLVYYFFFHTSSNEETDDRQISRDDVLEALAQFELKYNPKLKYGYTEKSIQTQLHDFLREKFKRVTREYVVEGINGSKIDFDIGNGQVGIEVKLASKVFNSSTQLQRLTGQIVEYKEMKYSQDNLIVLIAGEKEHKQDLTWCEKIENRVEQLGAKYIFVAISKN